MVARLLRAVLAPTLLLSASAFAAPFFFSTLPPNNSMGMASRPGPATGTNQETEAADDFILSSPTSITSATFFGLMPAGESISQLVIEMYRVFPSDSDVGRTSGPPTFSTPNVPTRVNSPSDVEFADRNSMVSGDLAFTTSIISSAFSVLNSVDARIRPMPLQTTGGDGPVRGAEIEIDVNFLKPFLLPADHYFFVPQVLLSDPNDHFLWLSGQRNPATTPFAPDLQAWIRNAQLDPDWLRVGTDIVGAGTFNGAFSLNGNTVPEPSSIALSGFALFAAWLARRRSRSAAAA